MTTLFVLLPMFSLILFNKIFLSFKSKKKKKKSKWLYSLAHIKGLYREILILSYVKLSLMPFLLKKKN